MNERFETFTVLISKINRNIRKIKNQEMANYNLRNPHISCLYYLYLSGSLTATDLCEKCEEDKATISRSLEYLEKKGYIFCESNKTKRYKSLFSLSEKGEAAGKKIAEKIDIVLNEISEKLTEEDRIKLYKSLTIISDRLDCICHQINKKIQ